MQSLHPLVIESIEALLIDVSAGGLGLVLKRRLAPQSEVKVRRAREMVFGQVRYCIPWQGGFRAGIKIRETIALPPP